MPDPTGIPDGSTAVWGAYGYWDVTFAKPSLLERIVTLDPGGYWETTCSGGYTQHALLGMTLLHVLGIATIAGVLFIILPHRAIG